MVDKDTEKKLKELLKNLKKEYNLSLCLCQIFGKRWSHYLSNDDFIFTTIQNKYKINDKWGLIIINNFSKINPDDIIKKFSKILNK